MPFVIAGANLVTSSEGSLSATDQQQPEDSQRLFCLPLAWNSLNPKISFQPWVFVYHSLNLQVFIAAACCHRGEVLHTQFTSLRKVTVIPTSHWIWMIWIRSDTPVGTYWQYVLVRFRTGPWFGWSYVLLTIAHHDYHSWTQQMKLWVTMTCLDRQPVWLLFEEDSLCHPSFSSW